MRRDNSNLFTTEQETLQTALKLMADETYAADHLLPHYRVLARQYQKLLRLCRKIFSISDSQGFILQQKQNELQMLLDNAGQGFLTFGPDLKVNRQYSQECEKIFEKKIAGIRIVELLGSRDNLAEAELTECLQQAFGLPADECRNLLQKLSGVMTIHEKNVRIEYKKIAGTDNEPDRIMSILTDITEKLRADAQIHYLSFHDKLTNLYNRAYAERVMPTLEQADQLPLSIIMIDMNGLKVINDVFGHSSGDRQLTSLSKVLREACGRQADLVCRWGGDEFVAFLPRTSQEECLAICQQIQELCREAPACNNVLLSAAVGAATKEKMSMNLAEVFTTAENHMYSNKLKEGRRVRQKIVQSLLVKLQQQCFEAVGHNERLAELGEAFLRYLGFGETALELRTLRALTPLHDIGKVAVPQDIWGKTEPLTETDWEMIQRHSDVGFRMAQSVGDSASAELILALHEWWNGQGYPYGLKEDAIPWLARVFAVIEAYEVMTHPQPYKAAVRADEALEKISHDGGTQFDPELAEKFVQFIQSRKMKVDFRDSLF